MSMADLLVRNATLPDGRTGVDVLKPWWTLVVRREHRRPTAPGAATARRGRDAR